MSEESTNCLTKPRTYIIWHFHHCNEATVLLKLYPNLSVEVTKFCLFTSCQITRQQLAEPPQRAPAVYLCSLSRVLMLPHIYLRILRPGGTLVNRY